MKKWTALNPVREDLRWQLMSECLNAKGAANEFKPWTEPIGDTTDLRTLESFDHLRLSSRIAPQILKGVKVQSSWTTLLGVIDGMNRIQAGWWPLCALYEAFGAVLIELGQDLDLRGNVLIAGCGNAARTALAAFFKAGFQTFLVTNLAEDEGDKFIREMRGKFFGCTIQWVPTERIVLLPGESSVVVNCTPDLTDNALLTELSYLNFLKRPGFLFELGRGPKPSALKLEALDAGVRVIHGVDLAARTDVLWAKWAFQAELDLADYRQRLEAALKG